MFGYWGQTERIAKFIGTKDKPQVATAKINIVNRLMRQENPDWELIKILREKELKVDPSQNWSTRDTNKFLEAIEQVGKNYELLSEYMGNKSQ